MFNKPIGIQKILWQSGIIVGDIKVDALIPLPANADACLESIGINDFADADDQWDRDFFVILYKLIDKTKSNIEIYEPRSGKIENKISLNFSDIPMFLSQVDDLNVRIITKNKSVTFTNGHQIFWITGFSQSEIKSLGYNIMKIENKELSKIY